MKTCPKCKQKMEKGLLVDEGVMGSGFRKRQSWALEIGFLNLKKPRSVYSYRCQKCGYIESFAPDR